MLGEKTEGMELWLGIPTPQLGQLWGHRHEECELNSTVQGFYFIFLSKKPFFVKKTFFIGILICKKVLIILPCGFSVMIK